MLYSNQSFKGDHKTLEIDFKRQNQKADQARSGTGTFSYPHDGKDQVFLDEWVKIMNSQKTVNIVGGIQTPVFSRTFSVFQSFQSTKNIHSESTRSQNYIGRDRYSFRERGNTAYSPQSSKVCIKSLLGEEEIGQVHTCDKSQELKPVHSPRTLYNGDQNTLQWRLLQI